MLFFRGIFKMIMHKLMNMSIEIADLGLIIVDLVIEIYIDNYNGQIRNFH